MYIHCQHQPTSGSDKWTASNGAAWTSTNLEKNGLSGNMIRVICKGYVSSANGEVYFDNVFVRGTPAACGASTPPTNLTVTPQETNMNISWDDPTTGDAVIVVMRETANIQAEPVDGTSYNGNSNFESGDEIGVSQNFVLYSGNLSTNSINVDGLIPNTSYTIDVFSSVSGGSPCYYLTEVSSITPTLRATNYYVNDVVFNGDDIYTSIAGNNTKDGLLPSTPKQSLTNILSTYGGTFLPGDSIFIDAGSYNDKSQSITDQGVNIVGAGKYVTIFDNNQAGATGDYFIKLNANDVTLSEATVQEYGHESAAAHAIIVGNGSTSVTGIEVNNVLIHNNGRSGGNKAIGILANSSSTFNGGGSICNENWISAGNFNVTGTNINLTITNYSLLESEYGSDGGAIRMTGGNSTQIVNIQNTYFFGNDVHSNSSGADIYMANGKLNVYDCQFENSNSGFFSNETGGSIKIAGGTATFKRSIFKDHNGTSSSLYGAAMGITGGTVTIDSCLFSGNSGSRGNDIYASGGTVTCDNCTFSSSANQIGQSGGASLTIVNSGNPSAYGVVTKTNTNPPTYSAKPSIPSFTGDCASGIVLPMTLSYFDGYCSQSGIELFWETGSEINNDYFTIERSLDLEYFSEVTIVPAAGNSSSYLQYQTTDYIAIEGINYYRLKQTDFDGKSTYSKPIVVHNNCNNTEIINNIYITNNKININYFTDRNISLRVDFFDIQGKLILNSQNIFNQGNRSFSISTNSLSNGVYIAKIFNENYSYVQKVIKK